MLWCSAKAALRNEGPQRPTATKSRQRGVHPFAEKVVECVIPRALFCSRNLLFLGFSRNADPSLRPESQARLARVVAIFGSAIALHLRRGTRHADGFRRGSQ